MEDMGNMVQAQQANDTGIASAQQANPPAKTHNKKMGFWRMLGMAIVALFWLITGEITNNKRRLIL
jgi:hypothetical protein